MARTETSNFSHSTPINTLTSSVTTRSYNNSTNITKDQIQRSDIVKTEFTAREGTYKISSIIDNLGKFGTNTCLNEPIKITLMTRIQTNVDSNSQTSSRRSSTLNNTINNHNSIISNQDNQSNENTIETRPSSTLNGIEINQQNGNLIVTEILAFNVGRELIIYEFSEPTQSNFGEPIDHRIYKQNHQPTCHDIMQQPDTNILHILVGFSKGQIQYINTHTKEQKVFNEGSYLDKAKVTCIKWLSSPKTYFAASYSSGYLYIFDEQLNHQRDTTVQPTYTTIKDDEKNFSISYLKNKTKQARNPVSRWSIGSGSINEFAFSPDHILLAVVSQDGFLRIFNYEKKELIAYMRSYFGGLLCVCWSPDGKYLATGGEDDFITLFSIDPEEHSPRVLCRGYGHTSWISAISFDPYMNAKTYYSSFIQKTSSSLNDDNDNCYERLSKTNSYTKSNSSFFDTNIPSLFYRIGSVGQDNRLCFWDITEDILKINKIHLTNNTKRNSSIHPLISSISNGYSSHLSDTTALTSTNPLGTTRKSSFSSLTSRLTFARNSNKVHKSIDDTPDSSLVTLTNGSLKGTRKTPLLPHISNGSKSTISNDTGQGSLSTLTNNSLSLRRTNFDLTKSTFGTNLCPRLDDIQIIEPIVTEFISHERLNGIYFCENCLFTSSQDGVITIWEKPQTILQTNSTDDQTTSLSTLINSEKPIEKVFTSLRIILWSNVLNKIFYQSKNSFLMMFDSDLNRLFINLIQNLNLINDKEKYFLEISSNDQQQTIENLLKNSKFISYDNDNRLIVNIEHVDNDYLLKSSKETSIRISDDNRLFDKLYTFGKVLDNYKAPAVIGDDRPSMKYDELSVDNYIKEVLAKIVNERAGASSFISMAVFKLQLMCRKANSIVHLRSNLETNHDTLFLLYTGARLMSILNNYNEKYQNGFYPIREYFNDKLDEKLMSKNEQEFLKWVDAFESRFLVITFNHGNKIQINLDKIFQEFILFCRRLSPYYSKVRILTENQSHLLPIMFARLELIDRIQQVIILMNSFGTSRKRSLGFDKENVWSSVLGIEVNDLNVTVKHPRLAFESATIDNNLFNSIPYSPPDNFLIKPVDTWSSLDLDRILLTPTQESQKNVLTNSETRYKNGSFRQVLKWIRSLGQYGDGNNAFREPNSVAWLECGKLAVVDTNAHCIKVFDSETGQFEYSFGRGRTLGCQNLLYPYRIAVVPGGDDQLVVIQRHPRPQIHIFSCKGEFIRRFGQHIERPRALTVDQLHRILVIESQLQKLHIFSLDGKILSVFNLNQQLQFPTSICSNNYEIFISDNHLHTIKVFSYNGQLIREIKEINYITYPTNIKLNSKGQLITIDNHQGLNITIYDEYQQKKRLGAYTARNCHSQILDVTIQPKQNILHLTSKDYRIYTYQLPLFFFLVNTDVKSEQSDDKDKTESTSSEVSIDQSTDKITEQIKSDVDNKPTNEINPSESKSIKIDESIKPKQNLIIKYHIEKQNPNSDLQEENLNLLKNQQNLPVTFEESQSNSNENDSDIQEENSDYDNDDDNNEISLTPEMEQADTIYHQAMKLINVTTNRQYQTAYKLFKQAANLGHIGAKEELAFGHIIGIYLPMDFNLAKTYFEEGVKIGSPQSHYGLYFMNSVGLIPNASISKALVHLTFAATDGYHLAQMALANRYWRSINVGHSCELALMFYQQAATYVASKITTASGLMVQRIRLYDDEEHPIQNNILIDHNLLQYYQLLADRGDPQAQYGIGQLYYFRDIAYDKALYYFRLAAENGNVNALAYLGKLYSEKNDFIQQNNQTALQFFQSAADKGNPIGQAGLGLAYYHGAGVEKNYDKAFRLFHLSADQSYAEGQLMLGVMYYNGQGIGRDIKMALKWFQAASQSGHILAYYNLAQMHATGTGVLRSCPTATELFKSVAERGQWSHMFTQAFQLYNQGHIEQAFMIYLYLAEVGYEVAQSNVAYIIDQMPIDISNIYKKQQERYKKALIYWHRAAIQGFHYARIKLGDYYFYGHGTEQNYELAASHYKSASDLSRNPQAIFNLAYMHEKGLGLKRDIHLAKRFYDMALETHAEAYLPVAIVLFRLKFQLLFENLFSNFFSFTNNQTSNTKENNSTTTDLDSSWDLYLMVLLLGLIGVLYTIRRQRMALVQQPVQAPMQ
ncbi:unnamed protein product [Rotaria sp. Silwood1]|nr:unnamed protein product [Rotaria sp. Silwood1]CAF4536268.1 unnamed protein product [Rotaria sp. Silwood1]